MKRVKFYFTLTFALIAVGIMAHGMLTPTLDNLGFFAISVVLAAFGLWAYITDISDWNDGMAPEPKAKVIDPSPRPDVFATRQWVEEMFNKNLSNVMHVSGAAHTGMLNRLERLERLSRQGGYLAFYYPKSVHELGFKEYCGTLFLGENSDPYSLFDIKVEGKRIVGATIVPKDHLAFSANANANYDHVCSNYFGRGTEMCDELDITKDLAESLIAAYKM